MHCHAGLPSSRAVKDSWEGAVGHFVSFIAILKNRKSSLVKWGKLWMSVFPLSSSLDFPWEGGIHIEITLKNHDALIISNIWQLAIGVWDGTGKGHLGH